MIDQKNTEFVQTDWVGYKDNTTFSDSRKNGRLNKLDHEDRAFHDWYRFVLSFPPHLVREYLDRFDIGKGDAVLDPFCGTGTTLIEAKRLGYSPIGFEANSMAHFASTTKCDWNGSGIALYQEADRLSEIASTRIRTARKLRTLNEEEMPLLLDNSICPIPLHKSLIVREVFQSDGDPRLFHYCALALAKALVFGASNLHFGPEVGVRGMKEDADVVSIWHNNLFTMANDVSVISKDENHFRDAKVLHRDCRQMNGALEANSIRAVFTSPPYPNEKDYTRTTRLESVLLGFLTSRDQLRTMKQGLLRSNTRNVYKADDDDTWISGNSRILALANEIEARRLELGKTSGFEKLYSRVVKLYFGGMARHLAELRQFLQSGATLGYVVGDQASFFRIMINTGQILGEIAESLGYKVVGLDLFRTRLATATRQQIREEVLLLSWPGRKKPS